MRIGIISDTHDELQRAQFAVKLLRDEGAEVLFHCGDLIEPDMVSVCSIMPCYFVFGNNDCDSVQAIRSEISLTSGAVCLEWAGEVTVGGKRIAMTHGHLHKDLKRLLAAEPDYLFSGHSHQTDDCRHGVTRRINPGALHRARTYSVALLNLEDDELRFLNVPR